MRGRHVVQLWVVTRLYVVLALFTFAQAAAGDIVYYRRSLDAMASVGLSHTLVEYPLPAVAVLVAPWELSHRVGSPAMYGFSVLGLVLLTDALFMWCLHRHSQDGDALPVGVWLLAVPALGAVGVCRFDILPGVLVGAMVLVYRRRPVTAALAVAIATSVKLWPALLVAPLVAGARRRLPVLGTVAGIGLSCILATAALSSWWRVVSPLVYQGRRGLQVESVAATPLMVAAKLPGFHYRLWFAPSKAFEITGPGSSGLLAATTLATMALVVFLAALWWRLLVPRRLLDNRELVWAVLTATSGFIVLGRVLSPQYLLWLAPVAAAGLTSARAGRRALALWAGGLVLAMGLTQLVFPVLYTPMVLPRHDTWLALTVLVVRNLLLLALFLSSAWQAWRLSGSKQAHGAAAAAESREKPLTTPGLEEAAIRHI